MHLKPETRRNGFTLIELLIVIAIIAILAAMTIAVTSQMITRQRRVNTVNFFQSLDKILAKQVTAIRDRAMKEPIPGTVMSIAGNNRARARVIWVKLRMKQHFPESFREAIEPHKGYDGIAYVNASELPSLYAQAIGNRTGGPESAICLYLALKRKRGGVSLSDEEVKPFVKTAGNGLPMFVDGWENPIAFYRFPYQNAHMNSSSPAPAGTKAARYRDPLDPDGMLQRSDWSNADKAKFQQICHPPLSVYMVPTVASAGPDGRLGLTAPGMSGETSADAQDNIYGYLVRSGGNGRIQ